MQFEITIPTFNGVETIKIEAGSTAIFVGANGGGKTRLAVHIESIEKRAHRISAHRALDLNPNVEKITEEEARCRLRTGMSLKRAQRHGEQKYSFQIWQTHRWQDSPAIQLLNDFDALIQVLFAEQSNKALETYKKVRKGIYDEADLTKFEQLSNIWEYLLPDRKLDISGDDIKVNFQNLNESYTARDLSDGERGIFYLIGQTLTADTNSLLIIDEPELHVHPSIMSKLWDKLEAVREDCAFVFMTHELEFAAARVAQKFIVHNFQPGPKWNLERIPEDTGFNEKVTALILGSRRPILFVEGTGNSLDIAIYRCCFPDMTVIPRESCEAVIHSVVSMNKNNFLHNVSCSGIVDGDARGSDEINRLQELGISVLPVSEIENIILLPEVTRTIAEIEGYEGEVLEECLSNLQSAIFDAIKENMIDSAALRFCKRRVDHALKQFDFNEVEDIVNFTEEIKEQVDTLDITDIYDVTRHRITNAIEQKNLKELLLNYDDKGLLSLAARHLKNTTKNNFESWLIRILANNDDSPLIPVLRENIRGTKKLKM